MVDVLIKGMEMPVSCFGCPLIALQNDGGTHCKLTCTSCEIRKLNDDCPLQELPEHGDLIDRDALTKEINERIDAAIKWGVNAIADRDAEIKLRAEQAVATFCEASLTAKKLLTIVPASEEGAE